jgi:hypothetical protein
MLIVQLEPYSIKSLAVPKLVLHPSKRDSAPVVEDSEDTQSAPWRCGAFSEGFAFVVCPRVQLFKSRIGIAFV